MTNTTTVYKPHGTIAQKLVQMMQDFENSNRIRQQQAGEKEAAPVNKAQKPRHKISANKAIIPVIIILAILHIIIIFLIMSINRYTGALSQAQRSAGIYSNDASSFMGNTMQLSETASSYILMPQTENGEVNYAPLFTYAAAFFSNHRGEQVLQNFKTYDVSDPVKGLLAEANTSSDYMIETQLHSLALMSSVYPIPDIEPLNQIPLPALTAEESSMTDEQRENLSRALFLDREYTNNRGQVNAKVGQAIGMIQGAAQAKAGEMSAVISRLRSVMWITTATIIVILVITFVMLYRWILNPLGKFTKQIPTGEPLDEQEGFKEVTVLAEAYNDVLKRRNALDAILRSAAETDALTNLQNRYSFERYILELEDRKSPMAVLLFDVNYLKQTNDTLGHLAGDRLICTAANCISDSFGEKCYRFGGDEFAAIVEDCTPQSLQKMIDKFQVYEKMSNVSISYGYAYTPDLSKTTIKKLIDEADRNMYTQKRETHREHDSR